MTAETATRTAKPATRVAPATFVTVTQGNDVYWRVEAPAKAVGAKVIKVPVERFVDTFAAPNTTTAFPWRINAFMPDGKSHRISTVGQWERFTKDCPKVLGLKAEFPALEGTVVQTRPQPPQAVLARSMRLDGVKTVAETDDNYFASANWNLAFRQIGWDDDMRDAHARSFASHGDCVFSTPWLRDRYAAEFKLRFGKKLMPNMHVCGNHVPAGDWPERDERAGPLRVGFMGSTSHVWDVNLAYAALHVARQHGCDVVMIGYSPAQPDALPDELVVDGERVELRSEKSRSNIEKWRAVVSRHIPWVDPGSYHRAALPLDVGICPLRVDDFTLGKSDVKAVEYTISGAAVVCSNMPVYNRFWKHEQNCLLASSVDEFALQTHRLIKDAKLRYELVSNAQEYVMKERGAKQLQEEWGAVIDA